MCTAGKTFGLLVLLARSTWCQPPADNKLTAIDALAAGYVKTGKAPGLAVGVMHKGKVIFAKGYGLANVELDVPVTPNTVFKINSMTKQFTAAAIMLLAERGLLRTDDSLAKFLPDFPRASEITVKQLLTHTSGLSSLDRKPDFVVFSSRPHSIAEAIEWIHDDPFASDPGTMWNYSNSGFLLLTGIIEKASGQPFHVFMQKNIFEKLGLAQTAIDDPLLIVPHRAAGYSPVEGTPGALRNRPPLIFNGGGGVSGISTVGDLLRWHDALFNGRILTPASLREMATPARFSNGKPAIATSSTVLPGAQYGYGLHLAETKGHAKIGHTGTGGGFHSMIITYPSDQYTIVVLLNINARPFLAGQVESSIADILLGNVASR
jgi:D-alanyl-D-alanine carboxypeptidase